MKNKLAFTLIEVLLVLATIGLITALATVAYNQARATSRDHKRASDVILIQQTLESYHRQEGAYPEKLLAGEPLTGPSGVTYLSVVPELPTPADGNCTTTDYIYKATNNNQGYNLEFCLGGKVSSLLAGPNCATENDINSGVCSESFLCGDNLSYGGESYPTVQIGSQCWFAKNLDVGDYIGSDNETIGYDQTEGTNDDCMITSGLGAATWSCQGYAGIQKYCYGLDESNGGSPDNCSGYGGLYEWSEMLGLPNDCNNASSDDNGNGSYTMHCPNSGDQTISAQQQGICPTGWHIPSFTELQTLAQNADPGCDLNCADGACSCTSAGGKLLATSNNGTDDYGFSALAIGYRDDSDGAFYNSGNIASLWSSTPFPGDAGSAWFIFGSPWSTTLSGSRSTRNYGLSVRCVQDGTSPQELPE